MAEEGDADGELAQGGRLTAEGALWISFGLVLASASIALARCFTKQVASAVRNLAGTALVAGSVLLTILLIPLPAVGLVPAIYHLQSGLDFSVPWVLALAASASVWWWCARCILSAGVLALRSGQAVPPSVDFAALFATGAEGGKQASSGDGFARALVTAVALPALLVASLLHWLIVRCARVIHSVLRGLAARVRKATPRQEGEAARFLSPRSAHRILLTLVLVWIVVPLPLLLVLRGAQAYAGAATAFSFAVLGALSILAVGILLLRLAAALNSILDTEWKSALAALILLAMAELIRLIVDLRTVV